MIIDDLLSRRLLILSGKGGVGKSVVGMALATAATRRGKRVLLVEIDSPRVAEASRYLGAAPVGGTETELQPGLFTVNLNPAEVMEEYVRSKVPLELLVRKVVDSPIYHRFLAAAPGLKELMVLGKIMVTEEAREGWTRRPRYDLIIVDAPATGHGLAFLKVPQAASAAVPVGPVGGNARKILTLLRDPKRTALAIVAIPEEMAVVEAWEFYEMAVETGMHPTALILNGCHEPRFTAAQETEIRRLLTMDVDGTLPSGDSLGSALEAARRHLRRRKLTRFYQQRLHKSLPLPVVSLPRLFLDEMSPAAIALLADRLEAA